MGGTLGGARQGTVDPVLYMSVVFRMKRGDRDGAIAHAASELVVSPGEAALVVDRIWRNYVTEIPPGDPHRTSSRVPSGVLALGLAAMRILPIGLLFSRR